MHVDKAQPLQNEANLCHDRKAPMAGQQATSEKRAQKAKEPKPQDMFIGYKQSKSQSPKAARTKGAKAKRKGS